MKQEDVGDESLRAEKVTSVQRKTPNMSKT